MKNTLYYGDNLTIMQEHVADESVDLVYLDPPFNSARDYNVLFKQAKKDENQAQITAFTDTWQWSKKHYEEFFGDPRNAKLFDLMESLYRILGSSEMMAYLLMMAPRLLEMHRVLKPTGSLYLHCDPSASHYLKILLDITFGPIYFKNEIIWKRADAHNDPRRCGAIHDTLLLYSKGGTYTWNPVYTAYSEKYLKEKWDITPSGRRYKCDDMTDPRKSMAEYDFMGSVARWRTGYDKILELWNALQTDVPNSHGRIKLTKDGVPRHDCRITFLEERPGVPIQDLWTDINSLAGGADERMGYPTQKPLALLERIINASSNPGDVVLDPFCGCGTAVVGAEKLGRQWIGIDVTYIAIDLMVSRLWKDFELKREKDYLVIGDPKDEYSAIQLFHQSPKQFEIWAVGLVAGVPQPDKSGDKGVDGKVYFGDENKNNQCAVVQVKGGHLTISAVRDFGHVIVRDKVAMGYLICLDTPTKGMYQEADELGFFDSPSGRKIPKFQIRTIRELLDGKEFDFPKGYSLRSGGKKLVREGEQVELGF